MLPESVVRVPHVHCVFCKCIVFSNKCVVFSKMCIVFSTCVTCLPTSALCFRKSVLYFPHVLCVFQQVRCVFEKVYCILENVGIVLCLYIDHCVLGGCVCVWPVKATVPTSFRQFSSRLRLKM